MGEMTYAKAGVDRKARKKAKNFSVFEATLGKNALKTAFNTVFTDGVNHFVLTVDGVGTKILVAELAGKHEGIGVDAVAMVVNDCIRCGAKPVALADILDVKKSDKKLLGQLFKGISKAAVEAGAMVVGGETADVPDLVNGYGASPYNLNMACYGLVNKSDLIFGNRVEPGNVVVGLRSSGLHSNGISLARRVLFKQWGGAYTGWETVDGLDKPLLDEVLTPTRIYVKPVLEALKRFDAHALVNVTGDAYAKFSAVGELSGVGFRLNNFKPQRIFGLIQETALSKGNMISDVEMFRTFNMGWGFAVVTPKRDVDGLIDFLERKGVKASVIGTAVEGKGVAVDYASKRLKVV